MKAWIERSFRNRSFAIILVVALVPLLLCSVLMTQLMIYRSGQQLRDEAQLESTVLGSELEQLLQSCSDAVEQLAGSTVTRSVLRRGGSDSRILYQLLYRDTVSLRDYADFEVYDLSGTCLYTTAALLPGARGTQWGVLSAARSGFALYAELSGGLSGACPVTAYGGEVLGWVLFRMSDTQFTALVDPLLRGADEAMLVSPTWRMVASTRTTRAEATLEELRAQLLSGRALTGGQTDYLYTLRAVGKTGFVLILQQPQTYTAQVVRSIDLVAVVMGVLSLLLSILGAWWLSHRISGPVGELDEAMRRVEGGDYNVSIASTRRDEMGHLAATFDRMTAEYRQNLARSVQRERELNETRLRMLQSQLNPHFLYNTLDCMKWLGVTNGVPQIATLAADLAALLRAGISGSERITLEEELELIERYLAIQEIRFGDRFVCEIDVDERYRYCIVPKLILQPLVENAIIHGVADSEEGYIKLWAEAEGEELHLYVLDNGSGIPQEVLARINSHESIADGHLGLNNVDRIVRLSYGAQYGLSAQLVPGGGSCLCLRLPMEKGESHAEGIDR